MKGKNIWTIMKKEFARFFKDRRLVATLFLPGLLIYVIYSLLGNVLVSKLAGEENYVYEAYAVNMPAEFKTPFEVMENVLITDAEEGETDALRQLVAEQKADVLLVFPADFETEYAAAKAGTSTDLPEVRLYYNSVRTQSAQAYQLFAGVLDSSFRQNATYYFVFSESADDPSDLATESDLTGMMFSTVAPMLVLMLLFSGCMAVAPESIAGEKERGTFATMLVTPVRRSHIAVGKILSLSALSLISGLCSFVGLIFSLPKLMGGASLSSVAYTVADYAMLLGVVLSSVLVIVALVSVVSALAKSVKEATGMIGPLMIVVMLLGVSTMFSSSSGSRLWYLIPLYNSARVMSGIFSFAQTVFPNVLITVIVNVVAAMALSFGLTKMFDSEKIMFNK